MDADYISQLSIALIATGFGTFLGFVITSIINTRPKSLGKLPTGKYYSTFIDYRKENSNRVWVNEDVIITKTLTKLIMENENSSERVKWKSSVKYSNDCLYGKWIDITNEGALDEGLLIISLSTRGDLLYGYFTGKSDAGNMVFCPWILAKYSSDNMAGVIERGKRTLFSNTMILNS